VQGLDLTSAVPIKAHGIGKVLLVAPSGALCAACLWHRRVEGLLFLVFCGGSRDFRAVLKATGLPAMAMQVWVDFNPSTIHSPA